MTTDAHKLAADLPPHRSWILLPRSRARAFGHRDRRRPSSIGVNLQEVDAGN